MLDGDQHPLFRDGRLNGVHTSAVHAQVARAGTKAYLLFGLDDGSMLDVGGIDATDVAHPVVLIDQDGRRFVGSFSAAVREHNGRLQLTIGPTVLRLQGQDATGTVHRIEGALEWDPPASLAASVKGTLWIRSADRMLPASTATWEPYGEGWRLSGLLMLQGQITLSVTLFTQPAALHLIEVRPHHEPSVRRAEVRALTVRVVETEHNTVVRFQAEADDGLTGFQDISGQLLTKKGA